MPAPSSEHRVTRCFNYVEKKNEIYNVKVIESGYRSAVIRLTFDLNASYGRDLHSEWESDSLEEKSKFEGFIQFLKDVPEKVKEEKDSIYWSDDGGNGGAGLTVYLTRGMDDDENQYLIVANVGHFGSHCQWMTRPVSAAFFKECAKELSKNPDRQFADDQTHEKDDSVIGDLEYIEHGFEQEDALAVSMGIEGLFRQDKELMTEAVEKVNIPNDSEVKSIGGGDIKVEAKYNTKNAVQKESQSLLDFILPKLYADGASLSDTEASTLYRIWNESPTGSKMFTIPGNIDKKSIFALKTKGYIAGYGDAIELTEKGRKILVEMVTNEPNALEKKSEISYSKIKAKHAANKRSRQAFVKKASPDEVKPFNLKRTRDAGNDNEAAQE